MAVSNTVLQRSRLGRVVVERKWVTEEQLELALQLQQTSGQRLGEALVELGFVTRKQIERALRKQTNIRAVAMLVTLMAAPFQFARASTSADLAPIEFSTKADAPAAVSLRATTLTATTNLTTGSKAGIIQEGENNIANILQSGNQSIAMISQLGGNANSAQISQDGNLQVANISQTGSNNAAVIVQR
jgi:Curlin associated repeat